MGSTDSRTVCTKAAVVCDQDDGWNSRLLVAVLLRITFDCEHYMRANLWMPVDTGEPKAIITRLLALCTLNSWAGAEI